MPVKSRKRKIVDPDAWPGPVSNLTMKTLPPYVGVQFDRTVQFPEKAGNVFRIITYQAYNALGLIGSECNGVAVLLEEPTQHVICDEIDKQHTGYFGCSEAQWKKALELCHLSWEEFKTFLTNHPRTRFVP